MSEGSVMTDASNVLRGIDNAIDEVARARKAVLAKKSKQVCATEELYYLKSVVYAWTNTHRPQVLAASPSADVRAVDSPYDLVLKSTAKSAARSTYGNALRDAKAALVELRSVFLNSNSQSQNPPSEETPPEFAPLAADQTMRGTLTRRWQECQKC